MRLSEQICLLHMPNFKGQATKSCTSNYLSKFSHHSSQIREFCGVEVSSIALGTYLGQSDEITDSKVTQACLKALSHGVNFFDTAINYRAQRAEKSISEAFRRGILNKQFERSQVFVSSKVGFVPFEGSNTSSIIDLFNQKYVMQGIAERQDLISGCHCISPKFIENQINKSRENLQLETIDLMYLHNPETQLEEIPKRLFYEKLGEAFEAFEIAATENKIRAYGIASWNAFRDAPDSQFSIQLENCVNLANKAAKKTHGKDTFFKAIQLPLNLAMPEAAFYRTQKFRGELLSAIRVAKELGLSVATSAPLFQSRLCHELPKNIVDAFPEHYSQAQCALSFVSSIDGVDSVMVGMKQPEHLDHNLNYLKEPVLAQEQFDRILKAMSTK